MGEKDFGHKFPAKGKSGIAPGKKNDSGDMGTSGQPRSGKPTNFPPTLPKDKGKKANVNYKG